MLSVQLPEDAAVQKMARHVKNAVLKRNGNPCVSGVVGFVLTDVIVNNCLRKQNQNVL